MLKKLLLYKNTVQKMKLSQINARVRKALGLKNTLGVMPERWNGQLYLFCPAEELDFDPVFLSRFDVNEFEKGNVTFLHESEAMDWNGEWKAPDRSALWNFNLHYFEYLMSYVKVYKRTQNPKYMNAIKTCITSWIKRNPVQLGGNGWAPYTISLRLVYWFSCMFYLSDELDEKLKEQMIASAYEQFFYLSGHLEKDLLANHYFEDIKALILCAIVFQDYNMLDRALIEFKKECKEQILPDGMHYELSPMYHKIILEDILRVAIALRSINKADSELEKYIQPMLDVAYSFEEGLDRIPLFNDGGNNVAKSLESLLLTAKKHFYITPQYKTQLPYSGYYFFQWDGWKLIVDAGAVGPSYNAGHAHCDAMSFELFYNGKPIVVNCGTYAYQCNERNFFRSTAAHNTVMVEDVEQSQCWSIFRVGKVSRLIAAYVKEKQIDIHIKDQKNNIISRHIEITDEDIRIRDETVRNRAVGFIHFYDSDKCFISEIGNVEQMYFRYAEDYGKYEQVVGYRIKGEDTIMYRIKIK